MNSGLIKRAHVQEHIWSALIWANKSKAPIGIPPNQRADGHDVRDRPLCENLYATTFPHDGELSNQQIRTSPSAHLPLLGPDFSQDHLQPFRPRMNSSFGAAHPDTDRSYAEARERQLPQLIIVGLRPWSRIEMGGFCHRSMSPGLFNPL